MTTKEISLGGVETAGAGGIMAVVFVLVLGDVGVAELITGAVVVVVVCAVEELDVEEEEEEEELVDDDPPFSVRCLLCDSLPFSTCLFMLQRGNFPVFLI